MRLATTISAPWQASSPLWPNAGQACCLSLIHIFGLEECRKLGLERVLITCDKENIASAKTILSCGGVLENEIPEEGRITQRYWIAL